MGLAVKQPKRVVFRRKTLINLVVKKLTVKNFHAFDAILGELLAVKMAKILTVSGWLFL